MSLSTIERTVHYYHLRFEFESDIESHQENLFRDLFFQIKDMADPPHGRERDPGRFLDVGDKKLYINEIKFNPGEKTVEGKLRSIRTDAYPSIFDLGTDEENGLNIAEGKGLVETTHFIIDYSKSRKTLAIEFNADGARFVDLWDYLRKFGKEKTTLKEIHWKIVSTKGGLERTFSRMKSISEIVIKVMPANIERIKEAGGLFSAFSAAEEYNQPDYYTITAKYSLPKKGHPWTAPRRRPRSSR